LSATAIDKRRRAVLVICDGLRNDLIGPDATPNLVRLAAAGRRMACHRGVFPSVTRVAAATIATGCLPRRHGLVGNVIAVRDRDDTMRACNSSLPEFRTLFPGLTGRPGGLCVPSLMARFAAAGGIGAICSNASAGAAWLLDPTHAGVLYHPGGCFGVGGEPLTPPVDLGRGKGAEGDRRMTEVFCNEVLARPEIGLGILWLSEPDVVNHAVALGSAESAACLRRVDERVGEVMDAVGARRVLGEDIMLLVGSDHGHETVEAVVDIVHPFVAAGLKRAVDSTELLVLPQGPAGLVFAADTGEDLVHAVEQLLRQQHWIGTVVAGAEALLAAGLAPRHGLIAAFSLASRPEANAFGIPGLAFTAAGPGASPDRVGCGTHGGCGPHETRPFLIAEGSGMAGGAAIVTPTSILDIAPTLALHLGIWSGCSGDETFDGIALQSLAASPAAGRTVPGFPFQ